MKLLIKRLKIVFFVFAVPMMMLSHTASADSDTKPIPSILDAVSDLEQHGAPVELEALPNPYNDVLTQPLMTQALEKHLGRTGMIKILTAKQDEATNLYYRTIVMLMDSNKSRNNVAEAEAINEAMPVELAFIVINLKQLPPKIASQVLNTRVPFGTLLIQNNLEVFTERQKYFSVQCDKILTELLHCNIKDKLYGRTNTIVRSDSQDWLAHVVEILPYLPKTTLPPEKTE